MKLHLYVTPLEVSFTEIAVEEVPCLLMLSRYCPGSSLPVNNKCSAISLVILYPVAKIG